MFDRKFREKSKLIEHITITLMNLVVEILLFLDSK